MNGSPNATAPARERLPRSVWALGFVSMFMDISSEMIHSLLPVFLVTVLGASNVTVGLIEGAGEAIASISKLYSGWLSDRLGKRKLLTVIGYGLGALSKPIFAFAPSASWVLFARLSDRTGKGIRGAPRDALVSELAPRGRTGAAYGLRQSLDTVGAFAGPLLSMVLMARLADNFRLVFWIAVVPGLMAVATLIVGVREPRRLTPGIPKDKPLHWNQLRGLRGPFWAVVAVGAVLTLARFSEAFLILRAAHAGLAIAFVPLVLVVMNAVYASAAYPMGALSDRVKRPVVLAAGFLVLVIADIILAAAPNLWTIMLGVGLWGLHMGMTQGILVTLVADATAPASRGTAFGVFHLITGLALLLASLIAGSLWEAVGPPATFLGGAAFAAAGLAGMAILFRSQRP